MRRVTEGTEQEMEPQQRLAHRPLLAQRGGFWLRKASHGYGLLVWQTAAAAYADRWAAQLDKHCLIFQSIEENSDD